MKQATGLVLVHLAVFRPSLVLLWFLCARRCLHTSNLSFLSPGLWKQWTDGRIFSMCIVCSKGGGRSDMNVLCLVLPMEPLFTYRDLRACFASRLARACSDTIDHRRTNRVCHGQDFYYPDKDFHMNRFGCDCSIFSLVPSCFWLSFDLWPWFASCYGCGLLLEPVLRLFVHFLFWSVCPFLVLMICFKRSLTEPHLNVAKPGISPTNQLSLSGTPLFATRFDR